MKIVHAENLETEFLFLVLRCEQLFICRDEPQQGTLLNKHTLYLYTHVSAGCRAGRIKFMYVCVVMKTSARLPVSVRFLWPDSTVCLCKKTFVLIYLMNAITTVRAPFYWAMEILSGYQLIPAGVSCFHFHGVHSAQFCRLWRGFFLTVG